MTPSISTSASRTAPRPSCCRRKSRNVQTNQAERKADTLPRGPCARAVKGITIVTSLNLRRLFLAAIALAFAGPAMAQSAPPPASAEIVSPAQSINTPDRVSEAPGQGTIASISPFHRRYAAALRSR